jgi:hypothetical protein
MHDTPKINETTRQWINGKQRPTQFGAWKTHPGKDGHDITERSTDYFKRIAEEVLDGPVQYNIDTCLVCGTEVPPGPDFCSSECEERAKNEPKEGQ